MNERFVAVSRLRGLGYAVAFLSRDVISVSRGGGGDIIIIIIIIIIVAVTRCCRKSPRRGREDYARPMSSQGRTPRGIAPASVAYSVVT